MFLSREITSKYTISKLRELFCRHGLVDILVSDNGRQFVSNEFERFLYMNNVKHVLTAPGHPATNGQAENFVKTLKKSVYAILNDRNCSDLEFALNNFLFDYRNSQYCSTQETPSKLFLNRTVKTRFSSLKPPSTREKLMESNGKNVINYKGKREIEFTKGEAVLIRDYRNPNKPSWSQAIIKKQLGPRSYTCTIRESNRDIKRHLNQIRSICNSETCEINNENCADGRQTNNDEVFINGENKSHMDLPTDLDHANYNANAEYNENLNNEIQKVKEVLDLEKKAE